MCVVLKYLWDHIDLTWLPSDASVAVNNTYGVKAVDDATYQQMEAAVPHCVDLIKKCQQNDAVSKLYSQTPFSACSAPLAFQDIGLTPFKAQLRAV